MYKRYLFGSRNDRNIKAVLTGSADDLMNTTADQYLGCIATRKPNRAQRKVIECIYATEGAEYAKRIQD